MDYETNDLSKRAIKERERAKNIGKKLWIIAIAIGILGCIIWKWYALLISIGLAFLAGSIYSYLISKRVLENTGLEVEELEAVLKAEKTVEEIKKGIPITPNELIRKMKEVPEILDWSREKHLTISGPDFWGIHHIYIDNSLKHVIFCPKTDFTTHVFMGNPVGATVWRKYDKHINQLFSKDLNDDILQWKIYKDIVLYKGKMLPPKENPEEPYCGEIVEVETFHDDINDEWIVAKIEDLYNEMNIDKSFF